MKFQKLHSQENKWMGYNQNALYWPFYCLNDVKDVEGEVFKSWNAFFAIIIM